MPGDWVGITFLGGSSGNLNYIQESYAGQQFSYASTTYQTGIFVYNSNPTVNHTTISSSAGNDVEVASGGQPILRFNSYGGVPNGHYGVTNDGWTSGHSMVDASYSWWGDLSGPTAASNPNGKGTPASSGVVYRPWVGQVPGPVLSLSSGSGPSGTQVTVNGSGFQSVGTREMVNLYLGTQLVGTTQVQFDKLIANQSLGQVSTSIAIPSLSSGTYIIQAIGQQSGRFALATFTITAHATTPRPDASHSSSQALNRRLSLDSLPAGDIRWDK